MNLRALANSSTRIINPNQSVTVRKWTRTDYDEALKSVPVYEDHAAHAQIQPVPSYRLERMDGYVQGGVYKYFYFNEALTGVARPDGNDLIVCGDETYKVIEQSEDWENGTWGKVLGVRQ